MTNKKSFLFIMSVTAMCVMSACGGEVSKEASGETSVVSSVSEIEASVSETVSTEVSETETTVSVEETVEPEEEKVFRIATFREFVLEDISDPEPYIYDEKGRLIKENLKYYEYDENDNLITAKVYWDSELTMPWSVDNYEYDEQGRKIKYTPMTYGYQSDVPNYNESETYEYDDEGKLIRCTSYWGSLVVDFGKPFSVADYIYNEKGNLATVNYRSYGSDAIEAYDEYIYDDHDRLIKISECGADGFVSSEKAYEYDENDNLITEIYTDFWSGGSDIYSITRYEYDEYGNKIKETFEYPGDDFYSGIIYEYEQIQ